MRRTTDRSIKRYRPSPALVISLIALFVALGGTSYAAISLPRNSVGTTQLKKNAVTTKKIAAGAVTASKINPAGLSVPLLNGLASTAFLAVDGKAADSDKLDGQSSSAFVPSCPAGTTQMYDFCVSPAGTGTFDTAFIACVVMDPAMRLPDFSELATIQRIIANTTAEEDWTTNLTDSTHAMTQSITSPGHLVSINEHPIGDTLSYRCISTPLASGTGS